MAVQGQLMPESMSPLRRYESLLAAGMTDDRHQRQALALLETLHGELIQRSRMRWWSRWRRRPQPGLYLWGGVGRGKTLLMDLFHECLPDGMGVRLHFHRFMQRVHAELTELAGAPNPLQRIASRFAQSARVLCFDEFFVADIGDAMILGELMQALFARGLVLVATSNVAPDGLYENGLQRRRFLPAIEAMKANLIVHHMAGEADYRLRVLERSELYRIASSAEAHARLASAFDELAPEPGLVDVEIAVLNRGIRARRVAGDVIWFDFQALCDGPRSQNDYIELARCYHTVLLSDLPRLGADDDARTRRFISLIDEFYDRRVKLVVSAESAIDDLYTGERLAFEFQRTRSRLWEMQSQSYLASAHRGG